MTNLDIPGTEGPFVDDTATAYGLALAYATSGDIRYAQAARDYIDAWVGTTKGLVNACPDDGGCQTSLIVARVVPGTELLCHRRPVPVRCAVALRDCAGLSMQQLQYG